MRSLNKFRGENIPCSCLLFLNHRKTRWRWRRQCEAAKQTIVLRFGSCVQNKKDTQLPRTRCSSFFAGREGFCVSHVGKEVTFASVLPVGSVSWSLAESATHVARVGYGIRLQCKLDLPSNSDYSQGTERGRECRYTCGCCGTLSALSLLACLMTNESPAIDQETTSSDNSSIILRSSSVNIGGGLLSTISLSSLIPAFSPPSLHGASLLYLDMSPVA